MTSGTIDRVTFETQRSALVERARVVRQGSHAARTRSRDVQWRSIEVRTRVWQSRRRFYGAIFAMDGAMADGLDAARQGEIFRGALACLERWRRFVVALPPLALADGDRRSLQGLVDWYETVCRDDESTVAPPADGIDSLLALGRRVPASMSQSLAVANGAIHLAKRLTESRRALDSPHSAHVQVSHSLFELEVLTRASSQRYDDLAYRLLEGN